MTIEGARALVGTALVRPPKFQEHPTILLGEGTRIVPDLGYRFPRSNSNRRLVIRSAASSFSLIALFSRQLAQLVHRPNPFAGTTPSQSFALLISIYSYKISQ